MRYTKLNPADSIAPVVYATVDPFDQEAQGARLPDDSTYPAVPFSATSRNVVTSNAAGSAAITITPLLQRNAITPSVAVTAGGTVDWVTAPNFADVTSYSSLSSNFTNFRHVAWGVRILATSAVSATSGQLYGAYIPNSYVNTWVPTGLPTTPDAILAMPWSFVIPCSELNNEAIVCSSRRLDPSAQRYRSVGYPNAVVGLGDVDAADGWGSWVFILQGCGATNATTLLVEFIGREEMTPKPSTVFATGTVYPASTPLMDHVINVGSEMPTYMRESEQPGYLDQVVRQASRHAGALARTLGGNMAQGAIMGAGMLMRRAATTNWVRDAGRLAIGY